MNITSKFITIKGQQVFLTICLPLDQPIAIVQMNHGMAEHSQRYLEYASYLCQNGFAVYLHDHPAHGKTSENSLGYLNWKSGWDQMLDVIHGINKLIRKAHPSVPVFLFGHSMGSLLARHYNATYPMYFKGMVLSGTTNPDLITLKSSLILVKFFRLFYKDTYNFKWLNNLLNSRFNSSYKNPETKFEWLSSNKDEVQKYINDPLCGFDLSLGFLKNLLQGTLQMLKTEKNLRFRKNFSTLIISGKYDPVGKFGSDPTALKNKYARQGYFNTFIYLPDGRHELLNEIPVLKQHTYSYIANWMLEKLKGNF